GTTMSEDLRAYFLLKNINLSRDDRRSILLANASDYSMEGIEKALRISFYDVHEREKAKTWHQRAPPTGKKRHWAHQAWDETELAEEDPSWEHHEEEYADQVEEDEQWDEWEEAYEAEEQPLDEGASQDEEVDQAYAAYKESRKKLKEIQKSRGFFKGELTFEERKKAMQTEKQRTRCAEMQLVPKEVLALDLDAEKNAPEITEKVQITLDTATEKLTVLSVENVKDILPDKPISKMKVIELQHECSQRGLRTSGLKAQLADRLMHFFAGKPVPGHSTKFVQLGTRVTTTCTTSAASSDCIGKPKSFPPEMRTNRKGAVERRLGNTESPQQQPILPKPKPKSFPKSAAMRSEVPKQKQINSDAGYTSNFRGPGSGEASGIFRDPRTGLPVAKQMHVGKACESIVCPVCEHHTVLRQNRADGGLFFGCVRFGSHNCRGARRSALRDGRCSPAGQ
ncbi:unnamed protein product, partial [Effrenium voratum]